MDGARSRQKRRKIHMLSLPTPCRFLSRCRASLLLSLCVAAGIHIFFIQTSLYGSFKSDLVATLSKNDARAKVYFLPGKNEIEMAHERQNAILKHSKLLAEASNIHDPDTVWVVDYYRLTSRKQEARRCSELLRRVRLSMTERGDVGSSGWQLLLNDLKDTGSPDIYDCIPRLATLLEEGGSQFIIKLASRHLVRKRNFLCLSMLKTSCQYETQSFRDLVGGPWNYTNMHFTKFILNGRMAKYDHTARPDIVASVRQRCKDPVDIVRTGDVAHLWRIQRDPRGKTALRDRVSEEILSLGQENDLTVLADFVSPHMTEGRTSVAQAYIDALLHYKIIVVAQRDTWEDHLRMFEALVSGAMVLSDPWMNLPYGYKDEVNIVVNYSIADLKEKVTYYLNHDRERLEIARKGRMLALEQHMPWHRMERFILGMWPTNHFDPRIPFLNSS